MCWTGYINSQTKLLLALKPVAAKSDVAAAARRAERRTRAVHFIRARSLAQVRFCYRFSPTGELGYRGAVGLGHGSTV
jgi:hypothetical protein